MATKVKRFNNRKQNKKSKKTKKSKYQKGGAIYTFDLNDKIGGLPAWIPLNGTKDGDCPATDTKDLGFTNYGMTRGGARKSNRSRGRRGNKKTTRRGRGKSRKH